MDKKSLTSLFAESLFRIPDYQRGYAWETEHIDDFIQDIDALVEDKLTVKSHYTGTIVVYCGNDAKIMDYGTKRLKVVDVVDGQQRLTTSCLYLSVVFRSLVSKGESAFEREIPDFLYSGAICKLTPNNDTAGVFFDLLRMGRANTAAQSPHEARLVAASSRFKPSCLYLSVVFRSLVSKGESSFELEIPDFLYSGAICKLPPNNDTAGVFFDLLRMGRANTAAQSPHEARLVAASSRFQHHIDTQLAKRGTDGVAYLKELYHAVTQKLLFTFYTIEEECEIGMTFELMNSRGKDLSVLELLKNYLMHWVSRNTSASERNTLTALINKGWKDTYTNLGSCDGDEDQCLRIAWTLYCNHSPKNWHGYNGFKGDEYIPLRNFTATRTKVDTKSFISKFVDGLAEVSRYYSIVTSPTATNTTSSEELLWLTKIHHTGNIANFLPLMVAARRSLDSRMIVQSEYIALLKALECFAYRVFLYDGRRSNAGKSSFHRWASEVFTQSQTLSHVTAWVHDLTRHYATEESC